MAALTFDLDPELEALDLQNQELGKKGAQRPDLGPDLGPCSWYIS